MPILVICYNCDTTLYEGEELKHPDEIIKGYDGKCPSCKKRLSYLPKNIQITPIDIPDRLNPFMSEKEKSSRIASKTRTKKSARKRIVYVSSKPKSGGIWRTG